MCCQVALAAVWVGACMCLQVQRHLEAITAWEGPELSLGDKLNFMRETRHAFGRTALVLSGGGALGAFHIVRTLALFPLFAPCSSHPPAAELWLGDIPPGDGEIPPGMPLGTWACFESSRGVHCMRWSHRTGLCSRMTERAALPARSLHVQRLGHGEAQAHP